MNSGDAAAIAANGLQNFRRDTTWTPMAEAIVGTDGNADSLKFIPYSDGQTFELEKTIHVGRSGVTQNVMECSLFCLPERPERTRDLQPDRRG